jgi:hypothetical protein
MAIHPLPQVAPQQEAALVARAQQGGSVAVDSLVEPWRKPLFG